MFSDGLFDFEDGVLEFEVDGDLLGLVGGLFGGD